MPHPARDGHIRTTGFPVIGDKVFDGYFRAVRQPGGKIGETAVQFCGLLRVQFAPFGGQLGSSPEEGCPAPLFHTPQEGEGSALQPDGFR